MAEATWSNNSYFPIDGTFSGTDYLVGLSTGPTNQKWLGSTLSTYFNANIAATPYTIGDLFYANSTTTIGKIADVATGNALISGGVGVSPLWGKIGLTTHVSGVLPIANGGTNQSTFATPVSGLYPVPFYNGTSLVSSDKFGYDPVFDIIKINSNLANPQLNITTSVSGSANSSSVSLTRADFANGGIYNYFATSGSFTTWQNGIYPGSNAFQFAYQPLGTVMSLDELGNVNIPGLNASEIVATDASKNLVSTSIGIGPQATNGVVYFDGTSFTSDNILTWDGIGILAIDSADANPQINITSTVTGSANTASINLFRGDNSLGNSYVGFGTGSTLDWTIETRPTSNDLAISRVFIGDALIAKGLTNEINIPSLTGDSFVFTDSAKTLVSTSSVAVLPQDNGGTGHDSSYYVNSAVIFQDAGGGGFSSTGNLTYTGAGLNVGNNINITGSSTMNINSLSASQLVVTDGSKNLISGGAIPSGFTSFVTSNSASVSAAIKTLYYNTYAAGEATFTLPVASGSNGIIGVIGISGASTSGWKIQAPASNTIQVGSSVSSSAGTIHSTASSATDTVWLLDYAVNKWVVVNVIGTNITTT